MQKPTTLLANFAPAKALVRKLTSWQKWAIKRRQEREGFKPYKRHANGTVSGSKDLSKSAQYTARFAFAVHRIWVRQYVQNTVFIIDED